MSSRQNNRTITREHPKQLQTNNQTRVMSERQSLRFSRFGTFFSSLQVSLHHRQLTGHLAQTPYVTTTSTTQSLSHFINCVQEQSIKNVVRQLLNEKIYSWTKISKQNKVYLTPWVSYWSLLECVLVIWRCKLKGILHHLRLPVIFNVCM